MSTTTLYRIYPARVEAVASYRNSYGTAFRLWDALAREYLGCARGLVELHDKQPLWDLSLSPAVPWAWRLCLEWTFDRWVCPPALLPTLAQACTTVGSALRRASPIAVNHWEAFPAALQREAQRQDQQGLGLGLGCTSVSDPWEDWDPETQPVYMMEAAQTDEEG